MSSHIDVIRHRLFGGPQTARQLAEYIEISQPTVSRALAEMGDEIVRYGAARSIHYALRDMARKLPDIQIFRVDTEGRLVSRGVLIPVRPDGFVMRQDNGATLYSEGIPWWLFDMRPQGYLGRAFAVRHGAELGLPERIIDWSDTDALRALIVHGHDVVGNLLLGETARGRFLSAPVPEPITETLKEAEYVRLAREAALGELPGSSAGGEQPKFTTYVITPDGPRHVIVKFSESDGGIVSERWRDLLLAEHIALETLRGADFSAARTRILDFGGQRFLEVERFDRVGELGRRALHSLAVLDAEFVGVATKPWPVIANHLAERSVIRREAADDVELLWAFGTLIGNADMHTGNLSFMAERGRPYEMAPAYDMTAMAFRPTTGGGLPASLNEANISTSVANSTWRRAEELARTFIARVQAETRFSPQFAPCIIALGNHVDVASVKINRLG